jgi:hypothetical protein
MSVDTDWTFSGQNACSGTITNHTHGSYWASIGQEMTWIVCGGWRGSNTPDSLELNSILTLERELQDRQKAEWASDSDILQGI